MKNNELKKALLGNSIEYYNLKGKTIEERYFPLTQYAIARSKNGVNPYSNCVMHTSIAPYVKASIGGNEIQEYLNFSSQDYMGLSQNNQVKQAIYNTIEKYGIHTASSPAFTGRNPLICELEEKLSKTLGIEQTILFTAGWMACFGAIKSLVSPKDIILLDGYAHNSLQTAAASATEEIYRFRHNNIEHLEELLNKKREKFQTNGIFVVVESLYSMHSDIIDIKKYIDVANKYEAIVILDIAHDFGVMGENGLGVLEGISQADKENLVIIGAFTKAFATNGGFVSGKNIIRAQTMLYSPSYTFSNSISPIQTAVALECANILFKQEGKKIRKDFFENINYAINKFKYNNFIINGSPSPIIPVVIGDDVLSRLLYKQNCENKLLANLAEFPAVPKNQSLFRFQMMATHTKEHIDKAVEIFSQSFIQSKQTLKELKNSII